MIQEKTSLLSKVSNKLLSDVSNAKHLDPTESMTNGTGIISDTSSPLSKPIPAPRLSIRRQRNGKDTIQTIPNSSDPVVTDKMPLKSLVVISDKTAQDIKIDNLPFNVKINFGPEAATVNEVTDQIQDYAEPSVPVIIHTGTKNVCRESAKNNQQRLQRLETNLIGKKLTTVAFSSVLYRGNEHMRNKITQVNSEMLRICKRNKWLFIDSDNVDETCLITGSLKLNDEGVNILSLNFKNAILNFTAQQMNLIT